MSADGKATPRLDMQPAFLRLDADLDDLRRLASIAETVGEDALRRSEMDVLKACLNSGSYVPILLTKEQFENLTFAIGFVADKARGACESYQAAIEASLEARRCV